MNPLLPPFLRGTVCAVIVVGAALAAVSQSVTAKPQARISSPIDNSVRVTLAGSQPPRARAANDIGAVPSNMQMTGMSLDFSRTPAQQTALDALVAAQQNPTSPYYHRWITPDQYAAEFGAASSDIAAAETWLEQQGFAIQSVSRSGNRILFSGTAGQVAAAFGVPLHDYLTPATALRPATTNFAPSADISIPAALASSVLAIENLSNFRLHPHLVGRGPSNQQPRFTSSETGDHYLTPGDLATIYNVTPVYSQGYTGSNQSIAVVGQSAVNLSDITNFQTAVGIAGKTPILVLVPNSGTSTIYADGDEAESDLDLEYSSTIAKGAQVYFVYVGNSNNDSVVNSLEYAIDMDIAPVISTSYGECEPALGQSEYTTVNSYLEQAAAQGQTVVAAGGDDGSTDCYGDYKSTDTADNEQLAVDFPGSSQYVTSMGGTEFPAADIATGNNTYFAAESTTDIISSAKSYIPEGVWNDDAEATASSCPGSECSPLSSGGGGVSEFSAQPTWQLGTVGGVAIANPDATDKRMVPDISLDASPYDAPFAFCTSDTSFWSQGQEASCNDGLRDAATGDLTVGGGTSFDAPTFSGLVAILNQYENSTGQGVVNPTLYSIATTSVYSTAFHDINGSITTLGGYSSDGNQCDAGSAYCSSAGEANYAAGVGYDEASGLGSIDFSNLFSAWPNSSSSGGTSSGSFTVSAGSVTVASGSSTTGAITVTPADGFIGTVDLSVSDTTLTNANGCVVLGSTAVSLTSTAALAVNYTVYTSSTSCSSGSAVKTSARAASSPPPVPGRKPGSPWRQLPVPASLAGVLLAGCFGRRSRRLRSCLKRSKLLRGGMALGLLLLLQPRRGSRQGSCGFSR